MSRKKIKKTKTVEKNILFQKGNLILIALSFIIPLFFYIKTLCPTLSSYADAGEFPTAAFLNGFAHPPGYPLFTLIVKLFILLPFATNPAQKANLASAVLAAFSIAVFYILAKNLTKNTFSSFVAAMLAAFSPIFWRNAIVSEVFGFLVFFIAITFLLFAKWIETKNKKYFYWFLLACGFGIAHHQLLIFTLIPLFIYFLFTKKWKLIKLRDFLLGILTVFIGFLPYLYVYFYASHHLPVMNWENPSTLEGLMKLITRATYGTFTLTNEFQQTGIENQVKGILSLLFQNYQLLGSLLTAMGTLYLINLKKWGLLIYSYTIIFTSLLLTTFSGMPVWQVSQIQYLERFFMVSHIFTSLLIAFGISFVLKILSSPKVLQIFSIAFLIVAISFFISSNYKKVNQSDNYFADYFAHDVYASIPQNSILIMEGDSNINNLLYNRFVLEKRSDVYLILGGLLSEKKSWYLNEVNTLYPDLVIPQTGKNSKEFITDFISENSKYRQIYLFIPRLETDLELALPKINRGLVWEYVTDEKNVDIQKVESDIQNLLANYEVLNSDYKKYPVTSSEYSQLGLYLSPYIFLAELNDNDITQSEKYYKKAIDIRPDSVQARIELGDDYSMYGMEAKAVKVWRESLLFVNDINLKNTIQARIDELER